MATERLRTQDATLWCAQDPQAPLQVGALCLFEAGPLRDEHGVLRHEELQARVASCLDHFPRFRQRLVPVPWNQGRPLWVDDQDFDIARHLRALALPAPGGDAELRRLMAHLIEEPLDPTRPLWEISIVEGVAGDRVAVVPKISHVMADGMAVLEFALSVLDSEPTAVATPAEAWEPERGVDPRTLVVGGLVDRSRRQLGALAGVAAAMARPWKLLGPAVGATTTTAVLAPALPITRPVGRHRDFTWAGLSMPDLVAVKRGLGATVNDVVLAVTAGGLRHYFDQTGVPVATLRPRVLVPVSTHTGAGGEIENRFSMMVTDLPVDVADPVERVRQVHQAMERRKASSQVQLGPVLFGVGDLVPEGVLRVLGPAALRRQPFVNLAVTDLPGSRQPLYLLGSRLLELYPYVGVTANIAVIIGVLSYGDSLGVGITVDADAVPDADLLARSIEASARELIEAERIGTEPVDASRRDPSSLRT